MSQGKIIAFGAGSDGHFAYRPWVESLQEKGHKVYRTSNLSEIESLRQVHDLGLAVICQGIGTLGLKPEEIMPSSFSGLATAKALRSRGYEGPTILVGSTVWRGEEISDAEKQGIIDRYVLIPVEPKEFMSAVEEVLAENQ